VELLRGGSTVGVSPWHRRKTARWPWRGGVRGGGGAQPAQVKEEVGEGAWPSGPA
jgi:hypothetical protein